MDFRRCTRFGDAFGAPSSTVENNSHRSERSKSQRGRPSGFSAGSAGNLWSRANMALDPVLLRAEIFRWNPELEDWASGERRGLRRLLVRIHESGLMWTAAGKYGRELLVQLAGEPMGDSTE